MCNAYAQWHTVQFQSADTMAECKLSHVWSHFSSTNSQDAVCNVCGKMARSYGNTTNLVKHLRLNHNTEYEAFMMRRTEEESKVSGAAGRARQTSPMYLESFGCCRQALSRYRERTCEALSSTKHCCCWSCSN